MLGQSKIKTLLLGASALAFLAGPATAGGYIQTLGLGQRTSSLAGAVTAKSQDFDAFYTNPAGAADFDTPLIGLTAKIIDTTPLDENINDGSPAGHSITNTWQGEPVAIAPATGAYLPLIPGSVVAGLGIGAPFALTADYADQPFGTIVSNENTSDIEFLYIEAVPTVAVKLTDRISIGGSVNIGLAKHVKESIRVDSVAGTGVSGEFFLESDNDLPLPVAPWEFSTDPTAVTFTLGTQIKLTDTLKFGLTYREETPNQYEGDVRFFTQVPGALLVGTPFAGNTVSACVGPPEQAGVCDLNFGIERFRLDLELPRHLQFGFEWWALPNWALSFDAQWTNWSDATGWGSPIEIQLTQTQSVNAINNFSVGIGGLLNLLSTLPAIGGNGVDCGVNAVNLPCGINATFFNYNARDTWSFMVGSEYVLNDTWTLLTGYQYNQSFMPKENRDWITYDTDKHFITGGVEYTTPSPFGELKLNLGGQLVIYEDETIQAGQSTTAGGVGPNASLGGFGASPASNSITPLNAIGFGTNELPFSQGGYLWTIGMGATLRFGAGG